MTPEPTRERCGNPMHEGSVVKCDRPKGHESDCSFTGTSGRAASEKCGHGAQGEARLKSCACQNDFAPAQPVPEALGEKCCTKARLDQYATDTKDLHRRIAQERQRIRDAAKTSRSRSKAVAPDLWWHGYDTACLDVIAEVDRQFTLSALSDEKDARIRELEAKVVRLTNRGIEDMKAEIAALRAALRNSGHSTLCGLVIGDDSLCSECRAALSAQPAGNGERCQYDSQIERWDCGGRTCVCASPSLPQAGGEEKE